MIVISRQWCVTACRKHRGFALVVTLSLMILLTIMAVGLLSLSAVSLRASTQGAAMSEARANARLALMLALGELQKELGPDQRISAPGGQQLEEGDKSAGGQWTGVYDAWPAGDETRPSPAFRRWLISGDESVVTDSSAAKTSTPSANKVPLVAADADHDAVEAGLIKTSKGACAWWVGDQNMKAKLGGAVEPALDAISAASRLQSAPRAAHEVFFGSAAVAADAPQLDRLPSTDSFELLGPQVKPLFHDATAVSLGLLTNVRAGGFRKDLNFLLETPKPQPNTPEVAPLYSAGSTAGINLGELWVDHNIWAEVEYPSSPPKHADGGTIPSGLPFLVCTAAKSDPFLLYKHLPRLQLTLLYSLISKSRTIAVGKKQYDLFLVADPVFTIWNPFDVCLHVPKDAFATFKSWAIPYNLNLNLANGPSGSRASYTNSIKKLSNDRLFFFYGQLGRSQNLVLRPGEVQVIAQGFGDTIKNPGKDAWQFDGKLGWEFASGYAYPIPYETDPKLMNGAQKITYSMTPNVEKSNAGMFLWSYNIGELVDSSKVTKYVGSFNIDLVYSRLASESPISASEFPEIFPPLPLDASAAKTIAELDGNKWPICVFTYGLRTESDPFFDNGQPGKRFTGRAMLRANETSVAQDLYNLSPDMVRTSPLQVGMRRVNSLNSPIIECDANGLGYYGAEYGSSGGVSHVITRSIPRAPIHSLGALQHASAEGARFGQARGERSWFMQPSISHAISNSFAPSCFAPSAVRGQLAGRDAADHSYLSNLALWDTYFHSSITPRTTSAHKNNTTAHSEQKKRLEAFLVGIGPTYEPLPNERMRPWTSDPKATVSSIFPSNNPATDAANRIAASLMVDGMFNVNSTSVAAWRGFLSGLKGAKVPVSPSPALKKDADLVDTEKTPVASLLAPAAGEIDSTTLDDSADRDQWLGFRTLTDPQIEELAKAVVKQVRLRGPFLSIADFINRRPGNDKDLALSGPLHSALDDKDVSINEAFRQGERALSVAEAAAQGFPFPEAEAGAKAVCAPGYVKQGDLLTTLGPLVNVRGDTFVIRGNGEARDASGKNVLARSWCEAVVQRVPDFVDPSDEAHEPVPKSKINLAFGRRFNIVSFRYLDSREII
jgi:hypothetical protein